LHGTYTSSGTSGYFGEVHLDGVASFIMGRSVASICCTKYLNTHN
jgi:hypothetical protein